MRISVLCRQGAKGEERPCAFHLGGRRLPIVSVLAAWADGPRRYFEVSVEDGRRFVLRHDPARLCWELAGVFAASRPPTRAANATPVVEKAATSRWWRFGFGR